MGGARHQAAIATSAEAGAGLPQEQGERPETSRPFANGKYHQNIDIAVTVFRSECLDLERQIEAGDKPITIRRHGKAVAPLLRPAGAAGQEAPGAKNRVELPGVGPAHLDLRIKAGQPRGPGAFTSNRPATREAASAAAAALGDPRLTPEQIERVCQVNPEPVLELSADGILMAMTPTGGETGNCNGELIDQLRAFCRLHPVWRMFDSSTGFHLAEFSVLSPDGSLLREDSWLAPAVSPPCAANCPSPSQRRPPGLAAAAPGAGCDDLGGLSWHGGGRSLIRWVRAFAKPSQP